MNRKEFVCEYKDAGSGTIEGYASTWVKKPDSYGDVVRKGAFAQSLAEDWNGGKGIPLLWAHQMDDLKSFIGTATADEDDYGLHFVATFDDTEEAQRVRSLYKDGRLKKFSFAFDVMENGLVTLEDGTKANELRELKLFEISAVTVPANDTAEVVDVKSGRRNSAKDEGTITDVISTLEGVVDALHGLIDINDEDTGNGEDKPEANAAAEEQKESNPAKERLLDYIKSLKEEEEK